MRSSKVLCLLSALATALLVLSASVAAPILCRPFYYAHIAPLNLTRYGLPAEEIRRAYGEMMDYCLGLRPDFSAGVLPASPEGAAHFADVRALFLLDLGALVLSALVLAVLFAVSRRKKLIPAAPLGHGPGFWAAAGLAAVFLTVGGLAALDFQRAFVVFHTLFFPAARAAPAEKKASENVKKGLDILKKTAIIISAFKDSRLRCAEVLPRMQWSMI